MFTFYFFSAQLNFLDIKKQSHESCSKLISKLGSISSLVVKSESFTVDFLQKNKLRLKLIKEFSKLDNKLLKIEKSV